VRSTVAVLGVLLAAQATALFAGPHVPASDSEVLQDLPGGAAMRGLEALRSRLGSGRPNLANAREFANASLELGRREGDPRRVAQALTVLAPWTAPRAPDPPADVLLLAARGEQYLHRFAAAQSLLDRVLHDEPGNADALLMKAGLLEVQGELGPARGFCIRLAAAADPLLAIACLTSVDSRRGELAASYTRLREAHGATPQLRPALDAWMLGILADMAQRSGDEPARRRFLERAARLQPDDPRARVQFADALLDQGDANAVLRLLAGDEAQEAALLRLAVAGLRNSGANEPATVARMGDLLAASPGHGRELARFLLEVRGDARAALPIALDNWQHQREPEDLRLLLAAAQGAGTPDAAAGAREWIRQHRYEDVTLP
jgi:hypothetical protein